MNGAVNMNTDQMFLISEMIMTVGTMIAFCIGIYKISK
jgi:hypothetical protein